ncbi:MAG: MFS transporter [Syntrophorhabdales bacterium]|jgi:MFS family permease
MSYFKKILLLLVLMWGVVGLERMVMGFVLPGVQKDFGLNYAQSGAVIAIFALAWAIGTWVMGSLSDYVGRRPVIVGLLIFGGFCSWITGIAGSFVFLLGIRAVMGFAEGGIYGPASATVTEESPPESRARNVGLLAGFFVLFGGAIGPVLSTQLMVHYGWRFVFYVYAIPAIILGILIWLVMKEPASTRAAINARRQGQAKQKQFDVTGKEIGYWDVFKNRNIILMMLTWIFNMAWLYILTSFGVLYLAKVHQMPMTSIGLVLSGFGVGVFVGAPFVGMVSDRIGRRKTLFLCQVLGGIPGLIFAAFSPGTGLPILFAFILAAGFFSSGSAPILVSVAAETVGFGLAATAIGASIGVGELIGGGILPIVGGSIADHLGLGATMYLGPSLLIVSGLCGLFVRETAPRVLAKVKSKAALATP